MHYRQKPFGRKIELNFGEKDGAKFTLHYLRAEDGGMDTFIWTINGKDYVFLQNERQKVEENPDDIERKMLYDLIKDDVVHFENKIYHLPDFIEDSHLETLIRDLEDSFQLRLPKKKMEIDTYIRHRLICQRENLSADEKMTLLSQMVEISMIGKRIKLSGTAFNGRNDRIDRINIDDIVQLVREPNNKYDVNAIDVRNHKGSLGYIPKKLAAILAPMMDAGNLVFYASISAVTPLAECPIGKNGADVEIGLTAKVSSTGKIYKSLRKAFENATFSDDENKKIKSLVNALWIRAEELKEQFEQMTRCLIEEVENNLHTMQDYDMNMLSITDFSSNGLPYYTSNDSLIRELVGNRCYFDILAEIEEMEKKSKENVMQICKDGLFD